MRSFLLAVCVLFTILNTQAMSRKPKNENEVPTIEMKGSFSFEHTTKRFKKDLTGSYTFSWLHSIRTQEDWMTVYEDDKAVLNLYVNADNGLYFKAQDKDRGYHLDWSQLIMYAHMSYIHWFDMSYRHLLAGSKLYSDSFICFSQNDWSPALSAQCHLYDDQRHIKSFTMTHSKWGVIHAVIDERTHIMQELPQNNLTGYKKI